MDTLLSRRGLLTLGVAGLAAGAGVPVPSAAAAPPAPDAEPFTYGLNTSTVRGHNLPITKVIDLVAAAGYRSIEPWIRELDEHVKAGGSLEDLGKQLRDRGLRVDSAIGFFDWIVDDPARRKKGLEEARRNLEMVQKIGGRRLAAPPAGATDRTDLNLDRAAERYRALLELGRGFGVVPQVEVWGFSKAVGRLSEATYIAVQADHPNACVLPDVYHLYKGGSGFGGLRLLSPEAVHVIHVNDYPASPGRDKINDSDRVYPGDGVAPYQNILPDLYKAGFRGTLSVELFNKTYYADDPAIVLKTALEKLRAKVRESLRQTA